MNNTPNSNRTHITIFGKTNSGKSSLINSIIGQNISLVSPVKGTTTDPVLKAMELIPFGPVLFTDTAGLEDNTSLGKQRIERTFKTLFKTDFAIYVMDINDIAKKSYENTLLKFKQFNIPYVTVINKIDTADENLINKSKEAINDAILVSCKQPKTILNLKDVLIKKLSKNETSDTIIGDLLPYNSKVILVVPIDSEAPKGRIILPQVQLIRDLLDHGMKSYVVRDTELKSALEDIKDIDLVVTDSQAFKKVNEIVPENIKLTSFSILFSRYKGDFKTFLDGIKQIEKLDENSKILISENCTHNHSHEDIGRVKIPKMLNKYLNKKLKFDFKAGEDFTENLENYDIIIHCGACMINKKAMETRINLCKRKNIAITNYGMLIAYLTGILNRSIEIFKN